MVNTKNINLVGIGLGNPNLLTKAAISALERSTVIIGAKRMVDSVKEDFPNKKYFTEYNTEKIIEIIRENMDSETAVVFSGDISLFSGSLKLFDKLKYLVEEKDFKDCNINTYPGISSLSYLCAKSNTDISKVKILSFHGKEELLYHNIDSNEFTFIITSKGEGVKEICRKLIDFGLFDLDIILGENLSYENERITKAKASKLIEMEISDLNCMLISNPDADKSISIGLPDEVFARDKVPITKSEVRAVIMSKLDICQNSICYDIGAGSGSISIEMSRLAYEGKVYAIEKNPLAVELIKKNIHNFSAENIELIHAKAPDGLDNILDADKIFIGGSGGELINMMEMIFTSKKNPTIVISAITMETIAQITDIVKLAKEKGYDTEITAVNVSKSKEVGPYNMMIAQNMVFIAVIKM
ncbi:bifunctional cobalt-precorrin-7 (C(5))-methyltransferase/cobalt-precorrin-6B (C(15))-methyltransferase [Lachnoanaerobaculum sp. OBRC5-5]|uniref:bifunctional cobalt-precorrin-7 (C(5))-methyltransferase/cobalt-precorrin-6B (C(15))-methyltransferase n=1 Tax=Lachnoanaerobaculum sp. OBRC5-5 TaxID=936595 RepID=UPI00028248FE|nr:bifunctional cobalt-precorrin-7 (C(5))-methyltransferase/cobalt-precorrin-6B (C(15))-methyltransferase [Lachnoanaerobaculum sp. OBRC5-5]EJZ70877.1 precorrin-6y C5,15-methyltransferase (decarboxylating), CbiE subunit [Lachnoanaerobaculum sp. OBRC5-5]